MRVFVLVITLHMSTAAAANLDMEAFDLKRCLHWHMTSDTGGAQSAAYDAALAAAKAENTLSVFSAGARGANGQHIEKFGACSYLGNPSRFQCLPNQDYPFSGSTYVTTPSQHMPTVEVLACVSGCEGVPKVVYVISQDIVDEETFTQARSALTSEFRRTCGKH